MAFARDILGTELWERQRAIAQVVADGALRVSVRSGHKTGKTRLLCVLALWWLFTRDRARVITTSASGRQVRSVIWKEIRHVAIREARVKLPDVEDGLHKVPDAGYQLDDGREILGFSTNEPEKMAGFSGPEQLFLLDEASGIPEEIFEAIEGNRAGGVVIVMFSNPTRTSGEFFESHHSKAKSERNPHGYVTFRLSSEDAAKVDPHIPGLARQEYIDEKRTEWGIESALYAVRILGEFPTQGTLSVVPLHFTVAAIERGASYRALAHHADATWDEELEALIERELKDDPHARLDVGVDVARTGSDKSVIAIRRGPLLYPLARFTNQDGPSLAAEVIKLVTTHRQRLRARGLAEPRTPRVKVDANGVGASVFDALAAYANAHPGEMLVFDVMTGSAPTRDEHEHEYENLRAQIAYETRAWLQTAAIPDDDQLCKDLVAPEFKFHPKTRRILIESKDDLRKRLGRSPDDGDALNLCVYEPPEPHDPYTVDHVGSVPFTR